MARASEGLTVQLGPKVQPDEAQMLKDIAALLGLSQNKGLRWALRFAHQHATSTADHTTQCRGMSPCATATKGLSAPTKAARVPDGQMFITHQATVEHHDDQHQTQQKRQL